MTATTVSAPLYRHPTLRLPEALKAVIDAAAHEAGVSANTWLLQQISRSTGPKRRGPGGRRMTGYGQS